MTDFAFIKVILEEISETTFLKWENESESSATFEVFHMFAIFQEMADTILERIKTLSPKDLKLVQANIKVKDTLVEHKRISELKVEKKEDPEFEVFTKIQLKEESSSSKNVKQENSEDDIKADEGNEMEGFDQRFNSSLFIKSEKRGINLERRSSKRLSTAPTFPCDFCERKFVSEKILQRHFTTLHQKIYK